LNQAQQLEEQVAFWTAKVPNAEIFPSALQNNVPEVLVELLSFARIASVLSKRSIDR
jgi:GTP-binding protein Era